MEIDLLFTDVVMPGPLRSPELARKARVRLPDIAVLFTSGYTENAIVHGGRLDAGVELLPKPYSREDLARKIRHVLANQQQRNQARPSLSAPSALGRGAAVKAGKVVTWTVLLVEDDDLIRSSTAEMLAELGHAVIQAADGASALQALESEPVDVLVADVGLPDLSGDELARRALKVRPGLGVVFATGDERRIGRAGLGERGSPGQTLRPGGSGAGLGFRRHEIEAGRGGVIHRHRQAGSAVPRPAGPLWSASLDQIDAGWIPVEHLTPLG